MKGVIFCLLEELITDKFGLALWDKVINAPETNEHQSFVSTMDYPDEVLDNLLLVLGRELNLSRRDLLLTYADYLFPKLMAILPPDSPMHEYGFEEFLMNVDNEIHAEVLKLNPNAAVPELKVSKSSEDKMQVEYASKRQLFDLAEGLIIAAAKHFNTQIDITTKSQDGRASIEITM